MVDSLTQALVATLVYSQHCTRNENGKKDKAEAQKMDLVGEREVGILWHVRRHNDERRDGSKDAGDADPEPRIEIRRLHKESKEGDGDRDEKADKRLQVDQFVAGMFDWNVDDKAGIKGFLAG